MNLLRSTEQELLRDSLRRYLADHFTERDARGQGVDAQTDRRHWRALCDRLGVAALGVPAEYGGSGGTAADLGVVFEECGRVLYGGPLLSTVALGVSVLIASDDGAAAQRYLPPIAQGTSTVALAVLEADGSWQPHEPSTVAMSGREGWRLSGRKLFVLDGAFADVLVVLAATPDGPSLFTVDAGDPAVLRRRMRATLDETRPQASVEFVDAPAVKLGELGAAWGIVRGALDSALVALASEQVGGAERTLEMSVAYAKTREQFGRLIGTFQSLKHRCADTLIKVGEARASVAYAAWCADTCPEELTAPAAVAALCCSEAYLHAATANIQIHGGIGFTWDHSAHLYFRRAKSDQLLLGDPHLHADVLAESALAEPSHS